MSRAPVAYLGYLFNGWCGHGCEYIERYGGFVPECGCPIHDPEKRWHVWASKVVFMVRPLVKEKQ